MKKVNVKNVVFEVEEFKEILEALEKIEEVMMFLDATIGEKHSVEKIRRFLGEDSRVGVDFSKYHSDDLDSVEDDIF